MYLARNAPPERDIADALFGEYGIRSVPVLPTVARRRQEYAPGSTEVILAAVEHVQLVDEDRLTWDQVLQFRSDIESRRAYRRFVHWLDQEMVSRSAEYIGDEIAVRMERSERALQKHGIQTVVGVLEALLDPKFALSAAAIGTGLAALGVSVAGAAATSALFVGKAACSAARLLIDRRTAAESFDEIAYVYQLSRHRAG